MLPFEPDTEKQDTTLSNQHDDTLHTINVLWKFFVNKRGAPLLPSCAEINCLINWLARAIHEETIKKAMDQTVSEFQEKDARRGPSLTRCDKEVKRLHKASLTKKITEVLHTTSQEPNVEQFYLQQRNALSNRIYSILNKQNALNENPEILSKKLMQNLDRLVEKKLMCSITDYEKAVLKLEEKLFRILLISVPAEKMEQLEEDCRRTISHYNSSIPEKKMTKMVKILVRKRLKTRFGISLATEIHASE